MPGGLTLGDIVSRLGGRVAGDPGTRIRQVGSLGNAADGAITFLASPKHKAKLAATAASAVILSGESEKLSSLPRIVTDSPYLYFARVSQLFNPLTNQPTGVHASAVVPPEAAGPVNCSTGALLSACKTVVRAVTDPQARSNDGFFAPFSLTIPPGTVFSAQPPAPTRTRGQPTHCRAARHTAPRRRPHDRPRCCRPSTGAA